MILPTQYNPTAPEHFIGEARAAARIIARTVALCQPEGTPMKFLFNGPPGVGKSRLAAYLVSLLQVDKFSLTKENGTSIKLEWLESFTREFRLTNLFPGYRVIWIDEADRIPHAAQVAFLTALDDLPPYWAVVCTSNCQLEEFQNRFQTRFQRLELNAPSANDIYDLMARLRPDLRARHDRDIRRIAEFCCGNVRDALNELQTLLMAGA